MKFMGHIMFTCTFFFFLLWLNELSGLFSLGLIDYSLLFSISLIYGLLPDVDKLSSVIGKIFIFTLIVLILAGYLMDYKLFSLSMFGLLIFLIFVRHRGIVHSIFGGLVFSSPLLFSGIEFFVVGLLMFIGHLVADSRLKLL